VGVVSEDVFAGGPNYRSCTLNAQVDGGVALIRQTFDWASIERSRGQYDFSFYDAYVAAAAQHGIRILPVLFNPPSFRSSRPRRHAKRGTYPPKRYPDMGRFGAVLVRRYGPRGSFWRARPDLPKLPIRSWQIWNEPHLRVYWPSGPSPRRYTGLLTAARKGIRRADRRAEVVTAALSQSNLSPFSLAFYVSGMYRAGARSAFDTLAINPYGRSPAAVLGVVRSIRRLMNSRGDRSGRIWITEFGWATGGRSTKFRVSQRKQARWVGRLLRSFHRSRRLRLRGAIYYNWRDANPYPPLFQDFFGLHTGLLKTDGSPKPAFWTFRRATRRIR
jgi:polysaccharide biosynthesis protein PslG